MAIPMDFTATARCQCVAFWDETGVHIDSSRCQMAPTIRARDEIRAFDEILVAAERLARQKAL